MTGSGRRRNQEMSRMVGMLGTLLMLVMGSAGDLKPVPVRIALNAASEVDVAEVVDRLARASDLSVDRPPAPLTLPLEGRAASLTRTLLGETLGPDATLEVLTRELVVTLAPRVFETSHRPEWERRLRDLAARATREVERRARYGLHARASYRPNDPTRPTVCLIHGLNSTSGVFKHMVEPLESAGYGLVVYDFPYNRDLDDTSAAFRRDWAEFRRKSGDARPWSIVAHSMGSLLARSYVEDDRAYEKDVASLILIAPPNHGSSLARAQTFLQMVQSLQAMNGSRRTDPLALLGDGLGAAADDMTPASDYLNGLNARPRRDGVRYHILAGDLGYLNAQARRQIEAQTSGRGVLGGIGRLVASGVSAPLDEITDGLGDGCVSVASTRLEGVTDQRTLHVNHLELIRAPLLFPDPGPVASMPDLLRWLGEDAPIDPERR
jgi:pimeloyl-ACP methyl ester carboxylesterase